MLNVLIIISIIANSICMFMNHKFGYNNLSKVKVRNAFRIALILISFIPVINIVVSCVYVGTSLGTYDYHIDSELEKENNKIIKWLFK